MSKRAESIRTDRGIIRIVLDTSDSMPRVLVGFRDASTDRVTYLATVLLPGPALASITAARILDAASSAHGVRRTAGLRASLECATHRLTIA